MNTSATANIEENLNVKRTCRFLPLTLLLLCSLGVASAQSLIDVNLGFGAAQAKATGTGIEGDYTYTNSANFGGLCVPGASTPTCASTKSLSGMMMGVGANLMLWKNFGVGMEAVLQPGKQTYAQIPAETFTSTGGVTSIIQPAYPLQTRVTFYDINGIFQPVSTHRASLQLVGGVGGANVKSYLGTSTSSLLGSTNYGQYLSSSNHFNLHAGVGVQIYLNEHVFIRPQVDIHYVPNFVQFGTNLVKQEIVWLGYTIGERQ
jgi:hypothetical protein